MYHFNQKETLDPQNYYYFTEGFSKEELSKIYKDVGSLPFKQATTIGQKGDANKSVRSSKIKWIPQSPEWEWLYEKLMDMAIMANDVLWDFDLQTALESIQYTEYYASEEGHYNWHQDIGNTFQANRRKVSITVQLSNPEEYEGGDLQIWKGGNGYETAPRGEGTVVVFPSYMMHRVDKVTKGTRRSFVLWVGGDHYR